jgi:transcriptional regulator with XRE-family HTH domain
MRSESKKLGNNLKEIRKGKGLSQEKVAKILRVSRDFIGNIENGKTNPTLATITKLAKAIGVPSSELLR